MQKLKEKVEWKTAANKWDNTIG